MPACAKSFIRYPGSKAKLVPMICEMLPDSLTFQLWKSKFRGTYCEPFVGAGAVASSVIQDLPRRTTSVILSDLDYWLICLWNAVKEDPRGLCERIDGFEPTGDKFYEYKSQDGSVNIDPVEAGFRKLALHQISFSGLGYMAGGPIGGREQNNSQYMPECRWRPLRLKQKIMSLHRLLNSFKACKITCRDFEVILSPLDRLAFVYLDPPYYEKGPELYKHSMTHDDHVRLAGVLKKAKFRWALSYDDHPEIRKLYSGANVREVNITYTTATSQLAHRPKNQEIIITP
jgi:DNA adenine methylase